MYKKKGCPFLDSLVHCYCLETPGAAIHLNNVTVFDDDTVNILFHIHGKYLRIDLWNGLDVPGAAIHIEIVAVLDHHFSEVVLNGILLCHSQIPPFIPGK